MPFRGVLEEKWAKVRCGVAAEAHSTKRGVFSPAACDGVRAGRWPLAVGRWLWALGLPPPGGRRVVCGTVAPKGQNIIARGAAPGRGVHPPKIQAPTGRNTMRMPQRPVQKKHPIPWGWLVGGCLTPLRGLRIGKNGTELPIPGLRPGLTSCAPSGRWPLGDGFGRWDCRLRGTACCVRNGRPEGAKHHSPGRSPGSRRASPRNSSPNGAKDNEDTPASRSKETPHRMGRAHRRLGYAPRTQGCAPLPRAAPWADILCPFGAVGGRSQGYA